MTAQWTICLMEHFCLTGYAELHHVPQGTDATWLRVPPGWVQGTSLANE